MPFSTKITPTIARLIYLRVAYNHNLSYSKIAREFNISEATVSQISRSQKWANATDQLPDEAHESMVGRLSDMNHTRDFIWATLYGEGHTQTQIAETDGVSISTVSRGIARHYRRPTS